MELKHGLPASAIFWEILLIVPYGIETYAILSLIAWMLLLIVPYGIETRPNISFFPSLQSFNRTLWNWNNFCFSPFMYLNATFNRTLWNWNLPVIVVRPHQEAFNRTLWNWNHNRKGMRCTGRPFNRTLWNWNQISCQSLSHQMCLLIVPYGIETDYYEGNHTS